MHTQTVNLTHDYYYKAVKSLTLFSLVLSLPIGSLEHCEVKLDHLALFQICF